MAVLLINTQEVSKSLKSYYTLLIIAAIIKTLEGIVAANALVTENLKSKLGEV